MALNPQLLDVTRRTKIILNSIQCVDFTPEGDLAVVSGNDGSLSVWQLDCVDNYLRIRAAHQDFAPFVKVLRTRPEFVSCSYDFTLKRWALPGGEPLATARGHEGWIVVCDVSPDERTLISGGYDKSVRVWDLPACSPRFTLLGHTGVINQVLTVDGRLALSTCAQDALVKLWDYREGRLVDNLVGHRAGLVTAAVTSDGSLAVTVGLDPYGVVWDLGQRKLRYRLEGPGAPSRTAVISHDGRLAVTADDRYRIWCWDLRTGRVVRKLLCHTDHVKCLAFSPDDRWLLSCGFDATLRLWDVISGECLQTVVTKPKKDLNVCAWSPDGRTVVTGDDAGRIRFYRVEYAER